MSARDDYPPASITSQWAEMCDAIDSLREQLAQQALIVQAAIHRDVVLNQPGGLLATEAAIKADVGLAFRVNELRALSASPPEATERVVHLSAGDQEAIAEALPREWGVRPMSDWIRPPAPSTGDRA